MHGHANASYQNPFGEAEDVVPCGKAWLLPYHTNKDPAEEHPEAYTWHDDLIVSRTRIPDPL